MPWKMYVLEGDLFKRKLYFSKIFLSESEVPKKTETRKKVETVTEVRARAGKTAKGTNHKADKNLFVETKVITQYNSQRKALPVVTSGYCLTMVLLLYPLVPWS